MSGEALVHSIGYSAALVGLFHCTEYQALGAASLRNCACPITCCSHRGCPPATWSHGWRPPDGTTQTHTSALLPQPSADPAVVVSFPLDGDEDGAHLVAWTTTPWTLPSNLALCVNAEFDYVKARDPGELRVWKFVPPSCRA